MNPPWFLEESEPYPLWADEGFGTRDDFAIRARGQINIKATGTATFVVNSDDGFDLRIDGDFVGEAGNRARGNSVIEVELTAGVHDLEFIHWERGGGAGVTVTIYRGTDVAPPPDGSNFELLEAFGGGAAPLVITEITYDQETDMITLTWTSKAGASYTIKAGGPLPLFPLEVDDGVNSGSDTTTWTFANPAPEEPRLFFVVEENE